MENFIFFGIVLTDYPQVFLKEYGNIVKEKKEIEDYIPDCITPFSDYSYEENF